jgi:hypothetical protein
MSVFLMFPKDGSPCLVLTFFHVLLKIYLFSCSLREPSCSAPSSNGCSCSLRGFHFHFVFSCSFMSSLELFLCSLRVPHFMFLHSSFMSSPKLFSCS